MRSLYVVFPGPGKVELAEETVPAPIAGQVLCTAEVTALFYDYLAAGPHARCRHG